MRSMVCASLAMLALCAPATSLADEIYRSTMRDGSVRYGEAPEYGARQVRKIPATPVSTGTIVVTPQEKGRRFTPERYGTAVLSPPERVRPRTIESGTFQSTQTGLAGRTY
jgi:hypothetical protein